MCVDERKIGKVLIGAKRFGDESLIYDPVNKFKVYRRDRERLRRRAQQGNQKGLEKYLLY